MRALVAISLVALSCGPQSKPPPEPRQPDGGPAPELCDEMCAHYRDLGCPEAEPTEAGTTCEELCVDYETNSGLSLNPRCHIEQQECPTAEVCTYSTGP